MIPSYLQQTSNKVQQIQPQKALWEVWEEVWWSAWTRTWCPDWEVFQYFLYNLTIVSTQPLKASTAWNEAHLLKVVKQIGQIKLFHYSPYNSSLSWGLAHHKVIVLLTTLYLSPVPGSNQSLEAFFSFLQQWCPTRAVNVAEPKWPSVEVLNRAHSETTSSISSRKVKNFSCSSWTYIYFSL